MAGGQGKASTWKGSELSLVVTIHIKTMVLLQLLLGHVRLPGVGIFLELARRVCSKRRWGLGY
jgi:hypothetical protein